MVGVYIHEILVEKCVAMSLTAIVYHQIQDISLWTNSTLNNILVIAVN